MTNERWVDVKGFEGYYMISDHGRVKSLQRSTNDKMPSGRKIRYRNERILSLKVERRGYHIATLCKLGVDSQHKVHRLVACHFLGNPPDGKNVVNHKDSNKINNHVSNLEWCDHWHNLVHSVSKGRKHKNRTQNIFDKSTCDIINDAILAGFTMAAIARYFKACPKTIATIRNKTHWSYTYEGN